MYNLIKSHAEGMRLQKQGDHAIAKIVFSKLLEEDPNNLENLNQIIVLYMKTNDFGRAISACQNSLKLDPNQIDILLQLGMAFYHCGDIRNCTQNIFRAFQIDPSRTDIIDLWNALKSRPYFIVSGGFQGTHAPERQVFMSAIVDLLKKNLHLNILEVGTYAGSSTLTWANAIDKLFKGNCDILCIDAWKHAAKEQYSQEVERALVQNRVYEAFLHNKDLVSERVQIDHIQSLSHLALSKLKETSFDIIYIDGCHYYEEVLADISECKRIINDGGIICGDDLELTYQEIDTTFAIKNRRSDYINDPKSGKYYHPGVTLAVHESFGAVSVFRGFWLMQRVGNDFRKVSFKNATGVLPKHYPLKLTEKIKRYFDTSNLLGALIA